MLKGRKKNSAAQTKRGTSQNSIFDFIRGIVLVAGASLFLPLCVVVEKLIFQVKQTKVFVEVYFFLFNGVDPKNWPMICVVCTSTWQQSIFQLQNENSPVL